MRVEFKELFPEDTRTLAKEIAAFGSSEGGVILLGVQDDGEIIGLDLQDRGQSITGRLEGICANTIRPNIRATFSVRTVGDKQVGLILVPGGLAPLYYVNNVPYIRHQTSSRPADPQEVIEQVLSWTNRAKDQSDEERKSREYLQRMLTETILSAECSEDRFLEPWLTGSRASWDVFASVTRGLAAESAYTQISSELREIVAHLDEALHAHEGLGSDGGRAEALRKVSKLTRSLKAKVVDQELDEQDRRDRVDDVLVAQRLLADLASRIDERTIFLRTQEFQREAASIGQKLCYSAVAGPMDRDLAAVVLDIGRTLLCVETRTIYADGGQSARDIGETIVGAERRLGEALGSAAADGLL